MTCQSPSSRKGRHPASSRVRMMDKIASLTLRGGGSLARGAASQWARARTNSGLHPLRTVGHNLTEAEPGGAAEQSSGCWGEGRESGSRKERGAEQTPGSSQDHSISFFAPRQEGEH